MYSSEIKETVAMKTEKISSYQPWIIWGLATFFYFYENCLQVSPGVMVPELMRTFSVDAAALGNLAAFYFYSYAPMQIPAGVLLDKYGPRRLLTLATAVCAIGCLLFGVAHSIHDAHIGRLLIGFGAAFAAVAAMKLAATWFPLERFSLLTGLMVTIGLTGSIVGETPLALMVNDFGWRACMLVLAAVGGVLLLLIWRFVRDKPPYPVGFSGESTVVHTTPPKVFAGLAKVLSKPQSWLVALYGGLMFAPTSIFGALWGVPFLMQAYHLARPAAASHIIFLFIGWVIGSPILGWISDRIGKRKPTMWLGSVGGLITISIILYVPNLPTPLLSALLCLFGLFCSGFLPSFSIMREISPQNASATALGFMNMLNMAGGALGQPLVGYLLDAYWDGKMLDGVRTYSLEHYQVALTVLPIMIAASLLIMPFIRETYCKTTAE